MVPGFLHKRKVAFPGLVIATFYLATAAAIFRIAPLLLAEILDRVPHGLPASMTAFGLSGLLGWLAAAVLAYNLWVTWRSPAANADLSLIGQKKKTLPAAAAVLGAFRSNCRRSIPCRGRDPRPALSFLNPLELSDHLVDRAAQARDERHPVRQWISKIWL